MSELTFCKEEQASIVTAKRDYFIFSGLHVYLPVFGYRYGQVPTTITLLVASDKNTSQPWEGPETVPPNQEQRTVGQPRLDIDILHVRRNRKSGLWDDGTAGWVVTGVSVEW